MKSLSKWAMCLSLIITVFYVIKVHFMIETDAEFYKATASAFLSEIGLWCIYYFARDHELCVEHEEHKKRLQDSFKKPE